MNQAVAASLYEEGAVTLVYVVLINCKSMLERLSSSYGEFILLKSCSVYLVVLFKDYKVFLHIGSFIILIVLMKGMIPHFFLLDDYLWLMYAILSNNLRRFIFLVT